MKNLGAGKKEKELGELWKMLRIAVGGLVENEICSYCKIRFDEKMKREACESGEFCERFILAGLKERL